MWKLISDRPLDVSLREIAEVKRAWPDRAVFPDGGTTPSVGPEKPALVLAGGKMRHGEVA
jgi:hypothetical protein